MRNPYLVGKRIYLRPLLKSDINKKYLDWLNDGEIAKFIETNLFPTTKAQLTGFYKRIAESRTDVMFAIVKKGNNLHIGNIKLGSINWVHRFADLGIMIGEKRYWGKGYGQEAIGLLLKYAFKKLNLNKVILGVYGTHKLAINAYQRSGFAIEGRIKKLLNLDSGYADKIIMGISKADFDKSERYPDR